jgi:hypothetical protein
VEVGGVEGGGEVGGWEVGESGVGKRCGSMISLMRSNLGGFRQQNGYWSIGVISRWAIFLVVLRAVVVKDSVR